MEDNSLINMLENLEDSLIELKSIKEHLERQKGLEKYLILQKILEEHLIQEGEDLISALEDKSFEFKCINDPENQNQSFKFKLKDKSLTFTFQPNKPFTIDVNVEPALDENALVKTSGFTFSDLKRKKIFYKKCRIDPTKPGHIKWGRKCSRSRTYAGPSYKVIVSEGDSWFQYPWVLNDIIDHVINKGHIVCSVGAAGGTLQEMYRNRKQYMKPIEMYNTDIFLISGGGNDLLRDIGKFIKDKKINHESVEKTLEENMEKYYNKIFTSLSQVSEAPELNIICHGYDYIIPRENGWIGPQLAGEGILEDEWKNITDDLIDMFNKRLSAIANSYKQVHYVDLRGQVGDKNWYDEIHPNDTGFAKVAPYIIEKIKELRGN